MSKKHILQKAFLEKEAIPAFNVSSLEVLQAIFKKSSELNYPVFIETSRGEAEHITPELLSDICMSLSKTYNIDYILHLDRAGDLEFIERCLKAGYNSISAEFGKDKTLDEIIELSKKARVLTDKYDAILEGVMEVVPIVYYENKESEIHTTDLNFALKFIEEVKPDMLCVAIGTQSGGMKNIKEIRYDILEDIAKVYPNLPLMIHGGSFIDEEIIKKVISLGVSKININAELRYAYSNKLKANLKAKPEEYAPYRLLDGVKEELEKVVEGKIRLMGRI
ncbi:MAG: class II fructose-bisphosphate aldolase [Candidatus Gracilibacteria bacterium]|nr:class II fructose-bisphosphate aldolase [Candidatus Gracilibacteria bacterium]